MPMKRPVFSYNYLVLAFISFSSFAQVTHPVTGDPSSYDQFEESFKELDGQESFIPGSTSSALDHQQIDEEDADSPYLPSKKHSLYQNKQAGDESWRGGQPPIGSIPQKENLVEFRATDLFRQIYNRGKTGYTLSYQRQLYLPNGEGFKQIFDGDKSRNYGGLAVHYDRYLWRKKFFLTGYSMGLAGHHRSGRGYFVSGEQSQTEFKLWMIPIDAHLMIGLPLWSFSTLYFSAGPATMILLQNRNDFEDGEEGKDLNQVSYGYSARGQLRFSMANIMRKKLAKLFRSQEISNFYLNAEVRYESFNHFQQSDISFEGTSAGLGFTFDFI